MMKWIFTFFILLSLVFSIFTNRINEVSNAAISQGTKAIELTLTLCGGMCLWCGVMRVAQKSGLTDKIAGILAPFTSRIFKGLTPKATELISMNITANLFGLGNAATPLGIAAMGELAKDAKNHTATNNMISFVVLNTASIQLIPTTIAALRVKYGSATPLDILPSVLICSATALSVGLILAATLGAKQRRLEHTKMDCDI